MRWNPMYFRGQMVTMREGRQTDPGVFRRVIDAMDAAGMNLLVVEVENGVQYESHPAVSAATALTKADMAELIGRAKSAGIQCVPLLPSFSHSHYLLNAYPELMENNAYASVVCPRHERMHAIVADLTEELIALFNPDFFHIGHDELLTSFRREERQSVLQCPRCRGDDAAQVYRDDILYWHDYLTKRGLTMMMWSDMLMAPDAFPRGAYKINTVYGGPPDHLERALDALPRDIIMCNWQYDPCLAYPSQRYLLDRGFDVLGCSKSVESSYFFTRYAQHVRTPNFLGMMGTDWGSINREREAELLAKVKTNGFYFGGGDEPQFNRQAETAEARRLTPGDYTHSLTFSREGMGVLDSAGWTFNTDIESPAKGLGLKAGRKGTILVPFRCAPGCLFDRFELSFDYHPAGPVRVGISVDNGRNYVYRPAADTMDWSDIAAGHGEVMIEFTITNTGTEKVACLRQITGRGHIVKKRGC